MPDERAMNEWRVGGARVGGPLSFLALPETRDVEAGDLVIVGIPFDTGTLYRVGSRFGPRAIRIASTMMVPYQGERETRDMFQKRRVIDYGDIRPYHGYMEDSFQRITRKMTEIVQAGGLPIVLGGDHCVSLPVLRALAPRYGKMSHLHFDSHPDFWEGEPNRPYHHGTTFRVAAREGLIDTTTSVQVGIRGTISATIVDEVRAAGYNLMTADDFRRLGVEGTLREIHRTLKPPVYVSLDIDVVDPAFAPGTGVPEPGGIYSREMIDIVRGLRGIGAVGFDLVEVSPPYDVSELTAILSATLVYEFMQSLVD